MAEKQVIFRLIGDAKSFKRASKESREELGKLKKETGLVQGAIKKIGPAIAAAFSAAAIAKFAKDAINAFRGFEKGLASLQGILGVTTDELQFFKDAAIELAKTSQSSAKEIVKAFELVGSAKPELLGNKEALKAVTEEVLLLSQASGLDLNTSVQSLTGTLNQFGLGAESARDVVDALAAGAKAGASAIPATAAAIQQFGTVAASAGLDVQQAVAAVETLADKGIFASEAGVKLRNILIKLQAEGIGVAKDGTFDLSNALEALQGDVDDVTKLTKLFNVQNVVAAQTLIRGRDSYLKYNDAVRVSGVALKQADANNATLDASLTRLGNTMDNVLISVGEKLAPAIKTLADETAGLVNNSEDLTEEYGGLITVFEGVAAVLGKLVEFVPSFSESLQLAVPQVEALRLGLEGLNAIAKGISSLFDDELTPAVVSDTEAVDALNNSFGLFKGIVDDRPFSPVVEDAKKFADEGQRAAGSIKALKEQQKELKKTLEESTRGSAEYNEAFNELVKVSRLLEAEQNKLREAIERTVEPIREIINIAGTEAQAVDGIFTGIVGNTERMAENVDELNTKIIAGLDEIQANIALEDFNKKLQDITSTLSIINDFVGVIDDAFQVSFDNQINRIDEEEKRRIKAAEGNKDKILAIQEDFEKQREEVQKKAANKEKAVAITKSIINTALSVTSALATPPAPNVPLAVLAGILGAAQTAVIAAQGFKAGVIDLNGPGTPTSDSIPARLSRGESVMTAAATRRYKPTLEAIQQLRPPREIIATLVGNALQPAAFSDAGIIGATDRQTTALIKELRKSNSRKTGAYYKPRRYGRI